MLAKIQVSWRTRSSHCVRVLLFVYLIWTVVAADAADDAAALMARVLATNSPWLNPGPARGTYTLFRRPDGQNDETSGPFYLADTTRNAWGFVGASRVGSMVWTPLHVMAQKETDYTLASAGTTNWNYVKVDIIDVTFSSNVLCTVGLGGQVTARGSISYAHCDHLVQTARMFIEPTNAVPLFMVTHPSPTNSLQFSPTWQFDPLFFSVPGGLAPRSFDWNEPSTFLEHQEFQVVDGLWLFRRGDTWAGPNNPVGLVGHGQTIEMTDLEVIAPSIIPITIGVRGSNVTISVQSGAAGFGILSADSLQGSWELVPSQLAADGLSLTVAMPTNKASQFYRLSR